MIFGPGAATGAWSIKEKGRARHAELGRSIASPGSAAAKGAGDKRQRGLDIVAKTIAAEEPGEQAPGWGYAVCLPLPVVSLLALLGVGLLCAPS